MMASQPPALHPLACTLCKARKVRCDRKIPQCSRCTTHEAECSYPVRQKKKTRKPNRTNEISALFERLQRVEDVFQTRNGHPSSSLPSFSDIHASNEPSPQMPTPASLPESVATSQGQMSHPLIKALDADLSNDVYMSLKGAVDQIQAVKIQKTFHMAKSAQDVSIPPDLARSWIRRYFQSMPANMTSTLDDNRQLLEMIPDLVDQEHVQITPSIMVLYYVLLYHGCCLPEYSGADVTINNASIYMEKTYTLAIRSLPAWQRSATGTTIDLSAAIMMTRAAVESYDIDLAYQMHKLACEYAERLNIHMLDDDPEVTITPSNIPRTDAERRRFWDLVQYDVYFRLMLNRPSVITADIVNWRVNLPYLHTGFDMGPNTEPAIMFLFTARITFEIATFYDLLDSSEDVDKRVLLPQVESICQNMRERYDEWQIDSILSRTQITHVNGWLAADAAIAGLMSIILILRTIGVTDSPLVLSTSRHLLRIVDNMLKQVPAAAILSLSFFTLLAFMPYATVANHALHSMDSSYELMEDVVLLERLKDVIAVVCQDEPDFWPLMRAMRKTCEDVRTKMETT